MLKGGGRIFEKGTFLVSADFSPGGKGVWGAPLAPQWGLGQSPSLRQGGLGERFELPQRGLERSLSHNAFWCILERILCISELSEVTNYGSATSLL